MEVNLTLLMASMLFLALGAVVGYYTRQSIASKQLTTAEGKANSIIEEAKQKYKEETLNAKNKAVEILEEAKKKEKEREEEEEGEKKKKKTESFRRRTYVDTRERKLGLGHSSSDRARQEDWLGRPGQGGLEKI